MSQLRVHSFSISIDGFGAGPNQDLENPLGVGGLKVFDWFFPTRTQGKTETGMKTKTGVKLAILAILGLNYPWLPAATIEHRNSQA